MHLADAFIQVTTVHSDYTLLYVCSLGIEPITFCAANAMLYPWATGTLEETGTDEGTLEETGTDEAIKGHFKTP